MTSRTVVVRAALAFLATATPSLLLAQAQCSDRTIRTTGVGPLHLGQTVAEVRHTCRVLRDTLVHKGEGGPGRALTVMIGADSIQAWVEADSVWRFDVTSPAFATRNSLRVGTPLHSLLRFPGARGTAGEGWLFVIIPAQCGLSFVMHTDRHFGTWDLRADTLATLPATMRVEEIWVHACDPWD